ncbi:Ras subfamily protein [Acanthamoeba castellanii str. Neff]|uniref:Ras subfamily protein n=1 Tax=Acanthamoeba castellanii (strain ATCC 30010 / Neff) TaxID=1257118 RepID=L8GG74_ACACF|nr:Ras subfamily protein [Acanthamoeba castellanii str. Neff]ELR11997.1 Ras subfamily protein [Acanthamoeba castellanii str. Neff]
MTWLRAAVSQFRHHLANTRSKWSCKATRKSAILRRYAHDQFEVYPSPTIGAEYERRCVEWQDNRIQLQLWDSSGPERYRSLAYLRGMHGVVVVYDIANRATFDNVTAWVEEMQKYALIANDNSRRDWCNTNTQHQTVVHLMCLRGNIEGVRELLARRLVVDIDARNAHGDTALHYAILMFAASAFSAAARRGHDEVVRLLVAHGASRAVEGRFGTSAQAAIEFGQHHIVQRLRALALRNEDAQQLVLSRLPPEVVVHVLSFVANAHDLCSLSMVPDDIPFRPLAIISPVGQLGEVLTLTNGNGAVLWEHSRLRRAERWLR